MTSINALRFDDYSGIMICDEQRHWNDDRMKIFGADKIRPVVTDEIIEKYGIVAAYGNTGTSSIGDELRFKIRQKIYDLYKKRVELEGGPPEKFLTIPEIASLVFNLITEVKHDHVNENLKNSLGFTTDDFIQGEYKKDESEYKIKSRDIIDKAIKEMAGSIGTDQSGPVFGNAGILGGYDPEGGFQIYLFSMRHCFYEPVPSGFIAQGSGSDMTNVSFSRFFNNLTTIERKGDINRVEGLIIAIDAVNQASFNNIGVGGYFNIFLFNGKKSNNERLIEINDHRSRFTSEMIQAYRYGFVTESKIRELVEGIFYDGNDLEWGSKLIWESVKNKTGLHRFLRGYPREVWGEDREKGRLIPLNF
ncbi:MAG TPA: hypothetical protein PL110_15805 [Candidatus Eremiobacteraeota bacterium]|nr:MAG: hypothetical protein BWY64_01710 [bacterium ADurb.Bin363]HPZ09567.1 hypothetical protein [Candidatus Eremiobacteraeota bacterium]